MVPTFQEAVMRTVTTAAAASIAAVMLGGCSFDAQLNSAPLVTRDVLQGEITERLTAAGERPQSVTCREDLIGEVGRTARCEVVVNPTNSFEPVVTVTKVDGTAIDYEMTPAVSKEQLEQAVRRLVAETGVPVDAATCQSGLDGAVGATARCDVTSKGVTSARTAKVRSIDGLLMNFDLLPG
jgi:hypothetical protein